MILLGNRKLQVLRLTIGLDQGHDQPQRLVQKRGQELLGCEAQSWI
jgi:hypothetical protein